MVKVFLSSLDKLYSSDTPQSCTISIQNRGLRNVKSIRVLQFALPNTLYNVSSSYSNNKMLWNRGGTDYSFTIPNGQYTISNLHTTIENGMNATDANNYDLTYSSTTFKSSISGTNAFTLNWSTNPSSSNGCYKELGWNKSDTSSATSHTSQNAISLNDPVFIFMSLDLGSSINVMATTSSSSTSNHFTFLFPMTEREGNLIFVDKDTLENVLHFPTAINITEIKVKLYNKNNVLLDTNGSDWNMVWEVE